MEREIHYAHQWLRAGDEIFPALLAAIDASRQSVGLEMYNVSGGELAGRVQAALVRAQQRGVQVRVLYDAVGSILLVGDFWAPLREAGGEIRQFNPLTLKRFGIRDHRKLIVCDGKVAFIGGFNLAPEYEGDGVHRGWWDLGLKLDGPLVARLSESFEDAFQRANFQHRRFARLRKTTASKTQPGPREQIFNNGPGRGGNPFKRALYRDLKHARRVQIIVPYFLPPWRLRYDLLRVARRGGRVQLLLPGRSDVPLSKLAAQSLYRRLLRGGIQIYEYQPQILHAKLLIVDDTVYAGSSNLDPRSLTINYELMVRFQNRALAKEARALFAARLAHARLIAKADWNRSETFWSRCKQRWARFLLSRIDPYLARWQWRSLPK